MKGGIIMTHIELIEKRIVYAKQRIDTLYRKGEIRQSEMFNQWIGRYEELENLKDILQGKKEA